MGPEAHLGDPHNDRKRNLRRFDYVLVKFGIATGKLGITAHGLRHEALIDEFVAQTVQQPPVRGGVNMSVDVEKAARLAVSRLTGRARKRAANVYCGKSLVMRTKVKPPAPAGEPSDSDST